MNVIIKIVEIIAACSVFFLVWNFRGVYYELKKLHDILSDWKTIVAILILILALIVHNWLISRQILLIVDVI